MTVMCRERFIRYMYARIYLMDESLRRIRHLVANYDQDPNRCAVKLRVYFKKLSVIFPLNPVGELYLLVAASTQYKC